MAAKKPVLPKRKADPPPDLATAFASAKEARIAWDKLAPSHQREYAEWITEAKLPATRKKRVSHTIAQLLEPVTPTR